MKMVRNKWFDYVILIFIVISSIQLAIENPLQDPDGQLSQVMFVINTVLTVIFVFEALAKIIASGLMLNGTDSYLRSTWNIIDFIIVLFSVSLLSNYSSLTWPSLGLTSASSRYSDCCVFSGL